jgi:hypothetical protein
MRRHKSLLAVLAGAFTIASLPGAAPSPVAPTAAASKVTSKVTSNVAGHVAGHRSPVDATGVTPTQGIALGKNPAAGRPHVETVTLITGDRVRVTTRPDGSRTAVPIPASGRGSTAFHIRYRGRAIEVVPADAAPLLSSGRVDRRLFDAAGLIAAGYTDASGRAVPLAVRQSPGRHALASAPRRGQRLETRAGGAATYAVDHDNAAAFWRWLVGRKPAEPGRPAALGGAFAAGVKRVELAEPAAPRATTRTGAKAHGGASSAADRPSVTDRASVAGPSVVGHRLTFKLFDRNGRLITALDDAFGVPPVVLNLDTEDVYELRPVQGGLGVQVPSGRYSFGEIIATGHGFKPTSYTHLAVPNFTVGGNRTIILDARMARRVHVRVDAPDARPAVTTFGTVEQFAGRPWTTLVTLAGKQRFPTFALPTPKVTDRAYDFAAFWSITSARGTYDLAFGEPGRVPDNPSYSVGDGQLARVDSRFSAGGTGLDVDGVWYREAQLPQDVMIGLGTYYPVDLPSRHLHFSSTRFGSAAQPLRWSASLDVKHGVSQVWYTEFCDARAFQPGRTSRRTWNPAAFRPVGGGERWKDGRMSFSFGPFAPSISEGAVQVADPAGISGEVTLRRPGADPVTSSNPFRLDVDGKPGESSAYTLELLAKRKVPWSSYATRVVGRWSFTSASPGGNYARMPLVNVLVTGAFDDYGRAPAGRTFRLDLPIVGGSGAYGVRSLSVDVSYDDGKTWRKATVARNSVGEWYATVVHPDRPGAYTSLRTSLVDDAGNRLDMTSIRAYGLAKG